MKILHLADLHIGKMLYGYSLIEDQRFLFSKIYTLIEKESIDAVIIAGDVYDRAVPSTEAVLLLDDFLDHLINEAKVKVLLVAGNHDSAARLNFGSRILEKRGLYIASSLPKQMAPIVLEDAYGPIYFYLLPFFRKADLKTLLEIEDKNVSLDDLLIQYLSSCHLDASKRNVLVSHATCLDAGNEEVEIGGVEWVGTKAFSAFDYVALGHLHNLHQVGHQSIYYAGSPLKYSVDKKQQAKALLIVELKEKGLVNVKTVAIKPLHEVVLIEDELENVLRMPVCDDYVFLNLLDSSIQVNAADRARTVFQNLLGLTYQHLETQKSSRLHHELKSLSQLSPLDLFEAFYEEMTEKPISENVKRIFQTYYKEDKAHED